MRLLVSIVFLASSPRCRGRDLKFWDSEPLPEFTLAASSSTSSPSHGYLSHRPFMAEYLHQVWAVFMPGFYWLVPCCQALCSHGLQLNYLASVLLNSMWEPGELSFVSGKQQSFPDLPGRVVLRSRIRAITNALDCSMVCSTSSALYTERPVGISIQCLGRFQRNKTCWLNTRFLQQT